jgi:hypothetical protein
MNYLSIPLTAWYTQVPNSEVTLAASSELSNQETD